MLFTNLPAPVALARASGPSNLSAIADEATTAVTGTLDRVILGNTVSAWITFGATLVGSLLILWLIRVVLVVRLKKWAERTTTHIDDMIVVLVEDLRLWLIAPAIVLFAVRGLTISPQADRVLHLLAMLGIVIQLVMSSRLLIDFGLQAFLARNKGPDGQPDPSIASSLGVLRVVAMIVVASIVVLLALQNLGVEIQPLLAGLGIGGIAVALALQNLLGDLFGSFSILLDKPFVVGDFIVIGDKAGTIEKIGIKTTRVRALSGEQIVFANSDLLGGRLHNYKRMLERRAVFTVSVTYETPPAKLRAIPGIIKDAINRQDKTRFDRSHLKNLSSYSLDFESVYYITAPDMNIYLDIQQAINLALIETFAAENIEFAYPTQVEYHREIALPTPKPAEPKP